MNTTTALTVVQRAVAALGYNAETVKELTELAASSKHITAITNADGYKQVHAARVALKNRRVEIEKAGKAAREDATAFSKAVIGEEKRLVGIISTEEDRLAALQKEVDDREMREREAKVAAEKARVDAIIGRIQDMRGAIQGAARARTAYDVAVILRDVSAVVVDDSFAEYQETAAKTRTESIAELKLIFDNLTEREAEAARQAAQRAELDKRQAEQDKRDHEARVRDQAERTRVCAIERDVNMLRTFGAELTAMSSTTTIGLRIEEFKRLPVTAVLYDEFFQQAIDARDASLARLDVVYVAAWEYQREQDRLQGERERQAAESARIAREAAELAERQRVDREETEARERATQEEREKKAREAAAECERNYMPTFDEVVDVVATHYKRPTDQVRTWIKPAKQQAKAA